MFFNLTPNDRQAILDRVYTHFIVDKQPAGHLNCGGCAYHGVDAKGRHVACAIGIFDTEGRLDCDLFNHLSVDDLYDHSPESLCRIFGIPSIAPLDARFLVAVQRTHDQAVTQAAEASPNFGQDFDRNFIEELARRLDRFAGEQDLVSPSSPRDLGAG